MFKKKEKTKEYTWSKRMLKKFIGSIDIGSALPGELPLYIRERVTEISFKSNESIEKHTSYIGFLARSGLENIYFSLSYDEEGTKENQNFIGYLEVLNGVSDQDEPVPMIRGFIKHIEFFDTVDVLLRDVKIFDPNDPSIILKIHIDTKILSNINTGNIFNTKIGIRHINIYRLFTIVE